MAGKSKDKSRNNDKKNSESINDIYIAIQIYKNTIRPGKNPIGIIEDIRNNDLFLQGYKQGNASNVAGYTADTSMQGLVDIFNKLSNL